MQINCNFLINGAYASNEKWLSMDDFRIVQHYDPKIDTMFTMLTNLLVI